jgi:2-hydroxychromene-2-carboxylate isomerase
MNAHPTIEFYFDPISPYAWLAARQRDRIESTGARLDFRPVLFGALLSALGTKGPAEIPAKRAYTMRDVLRIATRLGISMEGPPTHPFNPLRALRMCIALEHPEHRRRFGLALMDGAWVHGLQLEDDAVLVRLADECELDGRALLARAGEGEIKQRLIDATNTAIAEGLFGVPTFRYQGEIFWGEDRIDGLLWRVQGNTVDETLLARVIDRPASAVRKA